MAGILAKPEAARMRPDFLKFETSLKTPIRPLIQEVSAHRQRYVGTGVRIARNSKSDVDGFAFSHIFCPLIDQTAKILLSYYLSLVSQRLIE
jgi:hypothetical protein